MSLPRRPREDLNKAASDDLQYFRQARIFLPTVQARGISPRAIYRGVVCHAPELAVENRQWVQEVPARRSGVQEALEHMSLTRSQLVDGLAALNAELSKLEANGEPEEAMQLAFEHMVNASTRAVGPRDRLWWWGQLYSVMDRRAVRAKELAGLSRDYRS